VVAVRHTRCILRQGRTPTPLAKKFDRALRQHPYPRISNRPPHWCTRIRMATKHKARRIALNMHRTTTLVRDTSEYLHDCRPSSCMHCSVVVVFYAPYRINKRCATNLRELKGEPP
jgi:hypothetical protein